MSALLGREDLIEILKRFPNGHAHFRGADLSGLDLSGLNFFGATLAGACLNYSDLSGACFAGAGLQGAMMLEANFAETDLRSADLRGSDARKSTFNGANLLHADLSGARLDGVNFDGAINKSYALSRVSPYPEEGEFVAFAKLWVAQDGCSLKKGVVRIKVPSGGASGLFGRSFSINGGIIEAIEDSEGNVMENAACSKSFDEAEISLQIGDAIDVDSAYLTRAEAAGRSRRCGR